MVRNQNTAGIKQTDASDYTATNQPQMWTHGKCNPIADFDVLHSINVDYCIVSGCALHSELTFWNFEEQFGKIRNVSKAPPDVAFAIKHLGLCVWRHRTTFYLLSFWSQASVLKQMLVRFYQCPFPVIPSVVSLKCDGTDEQTLQSTLSDSRDVYTTGIRLW